jgi:hypothetical protein
MLKFIDIFLSIYFYLLFPIFALGVIGFFILLLSKYYNIKSRTVMFGGIFFLSTLIAFFAGFSILNSFLNSVQNDLKKFLVENKDNITIKINGSEYKESNIIIENLYKLSNYNGHHSHPNEKIVVELISPKEKRSLTLMQDSQIENEFWVFVNNYRTSSNNEVGRLFSDYFLQFIELDEFEVWNKKLKQTREIEYKIGKENLRIEYIKQLDSTSTKQIMTIDNSFVQVKLTYLPTGAIYYGLTNSDRIENYLEALIKLQLEIDK